MTVTSFAQLRYFVPLSLTPDLKNADKSNAIPL